MLRAEWQPQRPAPAQSHRSTWSVASLFDSCDLRPLQRLALTEPAPAFTACPSLLEGHRTTAPPANTFKIFPHSDAPSLVRPHLPLPFRVPRPCGLCKGGSVDFPQPLLAPSPLPLLLPFRVPRPCRLRKGGSVDSQRIAPPQFAQSHTRRPIRLTPCDTRIRPVGSAGFQISVTPQDGETRGN